MGSKSQTSTQQSSTTPTNLAGLQEIFNRVQGAASTPYTPYGGQLTAGINQQQQTGINNINSAAGTAQPYYDQASGYATTAGAAIDPSQISRYMNPYTQSVINATQANFNESNGQQQQQVKGNAAMAGALGGDRQAVAQAETARQQKLAQDPIIASLQSQGYTQALSAAQADRSAAGNAAGMFGSLGTGAQNAALQGANAQVGAGTLQQQTDQAGLTAQYQQYLQAQGFPYQQAQFFAQYGLPAASAQGSSTSGTSTSPGPNPWTQALGLGTAALGAFSDERVKENKEQIGETYDGQPIYRFNYIGNPMTQIGLMAQEVEQGKPEAVGERDGIKTVDYSMATEDAAKRGHFASGGSVDAPFNFISDGPSFIPKGQPIQIAMPQAPQQGGSGGSSGAPADDFGKSAGSFLGTAAKSFGNMGGGSTPDYGQTSNINVGGYSMPQFGNSVSVGSYQMPTIGFKDGGLVDAIQAIHGSIKKARGGMVSGSPFSGYADGGATFDDRFGASFPMAAPRERTDAEILAQDEPIRLAGPEAMQAWRDSVGNPAEVADAGPLPGPSPAAMPATANPMARPAALPPQITNPDNTPDAMPEGALAYDRANPMRAPAAAPAAAQESPAASGNTMGGWNPFNLSDKARQAIIAGGLGMAASKSPFALSAIGEGGLHGLKAYGAANEAERESADKKISQQQNQARIDMEAKRLVQSAEQFAKTSGLSRERFEFEKSKNDEPPTGYRKSKDGNSYEAIPGGPADPDYLRRAAEAKKPPGQAMDDDTAELLAERVMQGDTRALIGLGRGAQGAENIAKIQSFVARKAKENGVDAKQMLRNVAEQAMNVSSARALGTKDVHFGVAEKAMEESLPIALAASKEVPRTQWKALTELVQKGQTQINDPKLKQFLIATDTAAKDYARTINPQGVLRESDIAYARKILSTADSAEAYEAALKQLKIEAGVTQRAIARQKEEIKTGRHVPQADHGATPPAAATIPAQPRTVPPGSSYSPSRKQWRAPDGTIYNVDGSKA